MLNSKHAIQTLMSLSVHRVVSAFVGGCKWCTFLGPISYWYKIGSVYTSIYPLLYNNKGLLS